MNRKNFPSDLAAADIARGESKFAVADGVVAVKYRAMQDKSNRKPKVVNMLSTDHPNTVAAAPKSDKDGNAVLKTTCVLDYNRCIGGVDLNDQQLESILVIRKTYKWYKKLFFFHLMMQCLLSAYKLYEISGGRRDFLKSLHDVVTQLLALSPHLKPSTAVDSIARLTGRKHFPCK